jgi:membrane protein implicated in regulation of membrane protease activity
MALIWIEIIVAAVIFEGLISKRVFMWFVPAAIIASIMWFCKVETYWQIVVFLLVSALGILWAKLFLPKIMRTMPDRRTNIDAIIGNTRIVCNQLGYVYYRENLGGFDGRRFIEV